MRNFILKLFGMKRYISLIDEFEYQADQSEDNSVMVYPGGKYFLNISVLGEKQEIPFATPQERAAFILGMNTATNSLGYNMESKSIEEFDEESETYANMSDLDKLLLKKKSMGSA